jgi:outer membrane protein assembly factor BamB
MTTDQKTRASFQGLDRPVDPDPAFAGQLRDRFRATASAVQGETPVIPFRPVRGRATSARPRTRWLDLAAVAVLLIALSGGLLTLAPRRTDQRPVAIQAPMTEQPAVMQGGTAAQDNQYPGPSPATGTYEFLRKIKPTASGVDGPAITYGDQVFVLTQSYSGPFVTTLEAIDVTTGTGKWQRELMQYGEFAVTPRGVVATVPATDIATPAPSYAQPQLPGPYRVALLSLENGDVFWESRDRYGKFDRLNSPTVLVDQQRVFVLDRLGTVFSLDLSTGDEIWRHSYDQAPAPSVDQQICPPDAPAPGNCWPRSDMVSHIAIMGSTLYFSDPASATVTALSADDGTERWRIFTPDRVPSRTSVESLVAFDGGVALQLFDAEKEAATLNYVGFWAANDGAEVWSGEAVGSSMVSDGTALYLRTTFKEPCCTVNRIDAATGKVIWSEFFAGAIADAYLSSGTLVLIVQTAEGSEEFLRVDELLGINNETREVVWRMQMPHVSCLPTFPVADNGEIACLDFHTSSIGTYRLTTSSP